MKRLTFLPSLVFVFILNGCGSYSEESHKKVYTLSYVGDEPGYSEKFQKLIEEFNEYSGGEYLKYSIDPSKADSFITLTKGLEDRDGKVGWGQWITETSEGETFTHRGMKTSRTIEYSMDLELDFDYVSSRINAYDGSRKYYELQKLVYHEIGHGLQMEHSDDPGDLMYPSISGNKDLEDFFESVRSFFSN